MRILISLKYFCSDQVSGNTSCYRLWRERPRWRAKDYVFRLGSRGLWNRWRQILWREDTEAQYHSILFPPQIYALSYAVKNKFHSGLRDVPICTGSLFECSIFSLLFEMKGHCFINLQLQIKHKIDTFPLVSSIHSTFRIRLDMRGI